MKMVTRLNQRTHELVVRWVKVLPSGKKCYTNAVLTLSLSGAVKTAFDATLRQLPWRNGGLVQHADGHGWTITPQEGGRRSCRSCAFFQSTYDCGCESATSLPRCRRDVPIRDILRQELGSYTPVAAGSKWLTPMPGFESETTGYSEGITAEEFDSEDGFDSDIYGDRIAAALDASPLTEENLDETLRDPMWEAIDGVISQLRRCTKRPEVCPTCHGTGQKTTTSYGQLIYDEDKPCYRCNGGYNIVADTLEYTPGVYMTREFEVINEILDRNIPELLLTSPKGKEIRRCSCRWFQWASDVEELSHEEEISLTYELDHSSGYFHIPSEDEEADVLLRNIEASVLAEQLRENLHERRLLEAELEEDQSSLFDNSCLNPGGECTHECPKYGSCYGYIGGPIEHAQMLVAQ